jgi:hypothetical protein
MIVASKLNREKNVAGDINWAQALKYVESVRVELGLTDEK